MLAALLVGDQSRMSNLHDNNIYIYIYHMLLLNERISSISGTVIFISFSNCRCAINKYFCFRTETFLNKHSPLPQASARRRWWPGERSRGHRSVSTAATPRSSTGRLGRPSRSPTCRDVTSSSTSWQRRRARRTVQRNRKLLSRWQHPSTGKSHEQISFNLSIIGINYFILNLKADIY